MTTPNKVTAEQYIKLDAFVRDIECSVSNILSGLSAIVKDVSGRAADKEHKEYLCMMDLYKLKNEGKEKRMLSRIDENCKYCGMEYPYQKKTQRKGNFYFVFKDIESYKTEYITICPNCISTMVSTYQFGHKYELVGLLEDTREFSKERVSF